MYGYLKADIEDKNEDVIHSIRLLSADANNYQHLADDLLTTLT